MRLYWIVALVPILLAGGIVLGALTYEALTTVAIHSVNAGFAVNSTGSEVRSIYGWGAIYLSCGSGCQIKVGSDVVFSFTLYSDSPSNYTINSFQMTPFTVVIVQPGLPVFFPAYHQFAISITAQAPTTPGSYDVSIVPVVTQL